MRIMICAQAAFFLGVAAYVAATGQDPKALGVLVGIGVFAALAASID
jgi:hypothetical protein